MGADLLKDWPEHWPQRELYDGRDERVLECFDKGCKPLPPSILAGAYNDLRRRVVRYEREADADRAKLEKFRILLKSVIEWHDGTVEPVRSGDDCSFYGRKGLHRVFSNIRAALAEEPPLKMNATGAPHPDLRAALQEYLEAHRRLLATSEALIASLK